jgi:hypothetical protein
MKAAVSALIRRLFLEIPKSARLQRKFIEQIHAELFSAEIPLG